MAKLVPKSSYKVRLQTLCAAKGGKQARPLEARVLIDEVLLNWIPSTADGVMASHQRRYFRCAVTLPVSLRTTAGDHLKCMSINVSSNGLALNTPTPLELGAEIDLVVELTTEIAVTGKGVVIWDDKHGKAGIHFRCNSPEMQSRLDSWLERQSGKSAV